MPVDVKKASIQTTVSDAITVETTVMEHTSTRAKMTVVIRVLKILIVFLKPWVDLGVKIRSSKMHLKR